MKNDDPAILEERIGALLASESAPGWRLGLERIERLLEILGHPEEGLPVVHIAGTNGKGSCSTLIWRVLKEAGWNTGCYMSPHIHSYCERFLLNGQAISRDELASCLEAAIEAGREMYRKHGEKPTEFELLTAAAFVYYQKVRPEILVLETGLGGIYDATNVISPVLSVITSISLDHTALLGNSLAEIACNKAGIIKRGVPVAIGNLGNEARTAIMQKACASGSRVLNSSNYRLEIKSYDDCFRPIIDISGPAIQASDVLFGLRGLHQLDNLALSICALQELRDQGFSFRLGDLLKAIAETNLAGRMEFINQSPLVVLDLAHNPDAARQLAASLQLIVPGMKRVMLCGFLDDKERSQILAELAPGTARCYISRPLSERSRLWKESAYIFRDCNPSSPVQIIESIDDAVRAAESGLASDEYLLVTGSFYLAAPVRELFMRDKSLF